MRDSLKRDVVALVDYADDPLAGFYQLPVVEEERESSSQGNVWAP